MVTCCPHRRCWPAAPCQPLGRGPAPCCNSSGSHQLGWSAGLKAHCTLLIRHCTLHTAPCTLHTAHWTLHTANYTLHTSCQGLKVVSTSSIFPSTLTPPGLAPLYLGSNREVYNLWHHSVTFNNFIRYTTTTNPFPAWSVTWAQKYMFQMGLESLYVYNLFPINCRVQVRGYDMTSPNFYFPFLWHSG